MLLSLCIANVNPCEDISVAGRLRCSSRERVIRAIEAEKLAPWVFRIVCRKCRRDIVACETARSSWSFDARETTPF
jgi:hypothetical protein